MLWKRVPSHASTRLGPKYLRSQGKQPVRSLVTHASFILPIALNKQFNKDCSFNCNSHGHVKVPYSLSVDTLKIKYRCHQIRIVTLIPNRGQECTSGSTPTGAKDARPVVLSYVHDENQSPTIHRSFQLRPIEWLCMRIRIIQVRRHLLQ